MTNKQQALKWWENLSQEKREMYIEILFDEKNISDAEIIEMVYNNEKNISDTDFIERVFK